jgi:hypothetical protein
MNNYSQTLFLHLTMIVKIKSMEHLNRFCEVTPEHWYTIIGIAPFCYTIKIEYKSIFASLPVIGSEW